MKPASNPDQARVEQLLRDAHIQRMRQQWGAAETLCREALKIDPEEAMGLEMLGDLLAAKGSIQPALEAYRKSFEKQPQKAALETKIARLALQQGEEERERIEARLLLESPARKSEVKRNATIAILLSLVCPGAGQIFNRQYIKGGILLGIWLISMYFGVTELYKVLAVIAFPTRAPDSARPNDMLVALGVLGILIWIYGLLDASGSAGKGKKRASDV